MSKFTRRHHIFSGNILKGLLTWGILCLLTFSAVGAISSISIDKKNAHVSLLNMTENINFEFYLALLTAELRPLRSEFEEVLPDRSLYEFLLQLTTQLNRTDLRTLFGNELPGFHPYQQRIIIGQAGTNYSNLPVESSPPLEIVLQEHSIIDSPPNDKNEIIDEINEKTVFIYNTHNRESFLPHLDGVTDPNRAFHAELNVSLISERLKNRLENKGIGAIVDQTDFSQVLREKDWEYWQSYNASRPVVEEAVAQDERITYLFDIHRDSLRKKNTTITIDNVDYAQLFFVIGADFSHNDKNIELARELHERLEAAYPGISRGVVEMGGSGRNGVYNQDLSENAILIEFGGVDNTLEENYQTVDALVEVFSDYYWNAEAVTTQ